MDIKTNKGNAMPLCNGFLMCKQKLSSDGLRQFWECKDRKSGCRGRAVSAVGSLVLTQTQAHDNHGASPIEVKVCHFEIILFKLSHLSFQEEGTTDAGKVSRFAKSFNHFSADCDDSEGWA